MLGDQARMAGCQIAEEMPPENQNQILHGNSGPLTQPARHGDDLSIIIAADTGVGTSGIEIAFLDNGVGGLNAELSLDELQKTLKNDAPHAAAPICAITFYNRQPGKCIRGD